jgi:hypothetical protein
MPFGGGEVTLASLRFKMPFGYGAAALGIRASRAQIAASGVILPRNFLLDIRAHPGMAPSTMKTRNGKVARLPLEIRDQLNQRLADGEPGIRLVEWLNSIPAVMKVMAEQFDGRPINDNNVSEWRQGGYEEWLTLQSFLDETRVISENAGQVSETGMTSDHLHIVLLAHHAHLLQNLKTMPEDEFNRRLKAVTKLTASIMKMKRSEQNETRLQLQRERLELQCEIQSLKWSSPKTAASTSSSARPEASETRPPAQSRVSPSNASIPPTTDPHSSESAAPPLSASTRSESALEVLPGSSRIHPHSPATDSPYHTSFPNPDSLGLTPTQPSKLAA